MGEFRAIQNFQVPAVVPFACGSSYLLTVANPLLTQRRKIMVLSTFIAKRLLLLSRAF